MCLYVIVYIDRNELTPFSNVYNCQQKSTSQSEMESMAFRCPKIITVAYRRKIIKDYNNVTRSK